MSDTSTVTDEMVDAAARVLNPTIFDHHSAAYHSSSDARELARSTARRTLEAAAAVAPLVRDEDAVKAEALEDAASELPEGHLAAEWLRGNATALREHRR